MEHPSDFTNFPLESVLQKCESETIAQNIMKILERTGNVFRELTFEEYRIERLKDGDFSEGEENYFEKVIGYCVDSKCAKLFSEAWNITIPRQ